MVKPQIGSRAKLLRSSKSFHKGQLSSPRWTPRFIHELEKFDGTTGKIGLNQTERILVSNIFKRPVNELSFKKNQTLRIGRMGKYIQHKEDTNSYINATRGKIPYPNMSIESLKMNVTYDLMANCDFFIISTFPDKDQHILATTDRDCRKFGVSYMAVKADIAQACIWKLFTRIPDNSLDDFWLDGHVESYSNELFNKLKLDSNTRSKDKEVFIFFFSLSPSTFSIIENLFSNENISDLDLIGAHFSHKLVGGSQRLRLTLKNIHAPWEDRGDEQTMEFARVLKELASRGLVKSYQVNGCGLNLTSI